MHRLSVLAVVLTCLALAAPASAAPTFVSQWGTQGAGAGQFNQPRAVATDAAGNVYVADSGNIRIQKFTANGTFVTEWNTGFVQGSPLGIAVDTAGNVYAGNTNGGNVLKFTSDGTPITLPNPITGLSHPRGVAVDAAGNIYVAEYDLNRIDKFDATGAPLGTLGTAGTGNGQLSNPNSVALDASGNLYVTDENTNRVQKWDTSGNVLAVWGAFGTGNGQFNGVRGLSVGATGLVNVADFNNRRIQRFNPDGSFVDEWGGATVFNRPVDVAEGPGGNFYVADIFAHRILRFAEGAGGGGPGGGGGGPGALPPPVLGKAVNVEVVKGTVLVAVRGGSSGSGARAAQKGLRFEPLTEARQIPTGSFLDTKRGTVSLTSATGSGSKTQSGQFTAGIFQVLQSRKRRDKGLTELRLKGASFNRCRARRSGRATAAKLPRRLIRQLKANAKGRFRTRGRHSAATVRGTIWITADRCDGTLTTVKRGKVAVRDFRRKRTVIVRAGKSYLAKAPG